MQQYSLKERLYSFFVEQRMCHVEFSCILLTCNQLSGSIGRLQCTPVIVQLDKLISDLGFSNILKGVSAYIQQF